MTLILFILQLSRIRADELQVLTEKYLLNAKTSGELHQELSITSDLKNLKTKCEFELKYKKIPESCKIFLNLTKKLKLYSSIVQKQKEEILDRVCSDTAIVTDQTPMTNLGGRCQSLIEQKAKEKKYILEEKAPQNIIF